MDDSVMAGYIGNAALSSLFPASFLEGVTRLLEALGYAFSSMDSVVLSFATQTVHAQIVNALNVSGVPEGLYPCAEQLIAAEFLTVKKNMGQLDGLALHLEPAVQSLQEGDTNITWAVDGVMSDEQRLDALIAHLRAARAQFVTYRRLAW